MSLLASSAVFAQPGLLPGDPDLTFEEDDDHFDLDLALPTERTATRGIALAEQRITGGKYSQAIQFLDSLLAREEDAFLESSSTAQRYDGLKSTARRMLGALPSAGRDAYLLAFEARARNALTSAIEAGDLPAIRMVSRRYFHTPAGYQATLLLARNEQDHGRPASAAAMYDQLIELPHAVHQFGPQLYLLDASAHLQSGRTDSARRAIELLRRDYPRQEVIVGGVAVNLFNQNEDPVQWLASRLDIKDSRSGSIQQNWPMFRGDPARNLESDGGAPHMAVRWRVRMANSHRVERVLENLREEYQNRDITLIPSVFPVAVGDVLVMHSTHAIVGVDFHTGKRIWSDVPDGNDPQYDAFVESLGNPNGVAAAPHLVRAMAQRMWDDMIYGGLSSDGRCVYAIRDFPINTETLDRTLGVRGPVFIRGRPGLQDPTEWIGPTNRLTAFDLRSEGKQVWEINGADADGPLAGAFFLGAPLPLDGRLYVLAEIRGGIQLVVIRPIDSWPRWELEWIQQLANLESGILENPRRRWTGAVPSAENGVLVCPTSAGAVIGVDFIQRTLLWAYRYPTRMAKIQGVHPRIARIQQDRMEQGSGRQNNRWIDSTAILVAGRVLLAPPDSDFLHCLDLRTGTMLWKRPRENALLIACVHDQNIMLIGKHEAMALRLEDGEPAWKDGPCTFQQGVLPTGRGFLSEGKYFIPMSNGQIIALDVTGGTVVERIESHAGMPLGNLICHQGAVLSHNECFLEKYEQLDVVQQRIQDALAVNPDDPNALRELGEIAYNDNHLALAIQHIHRAYEINPRDLVAKDLLVNYLLLALEQDYMVYRDRLSFLNRLISDPEQHWHMERIQAEALHNSGDLLGAVRAYLRLAEQDNQSEPGYITSKHAFTPQSRWICGQLADIWQKANTRERRAIQQLIQPAENLLETNPTIAGLRSYLSYFDGLPSSDRWKLVLAEKLMEAGIFMEGQLLLHDLVESPDESTQGQAVAMLAELFHTARRHRAALWYDRLLVQRYANVICRHGKTGRQIVSDHANRFRGSGPEREWSNGIVEHQITSNQASRSQSRLQHVRIEGRTDPSLIGRQLFIDPDRQRSIRGSIVIQDELGNNEFSVALDLEASGRFLRDVHGSRCHAVYRGGLCIVSVGDYVLAIDALADDTSMDQHLMWDTRITPEWIDPVLPSVFNPEPTNPGLEAFGPNGRTFSTGQDGLPIGILGPVTRHGVAFQAEGRLQCVDPLTGRLIWSRKDIPSGCLLFGDAQYLFALPPKSNEAIVLRMIDGKRLGFREVPPVQEHLATQGRAILCWREGTDREEPVSERSQFMELVLFDPWNGGVIWTHAFRAASQVWLADNEAAGIVDPEGQFQLIDIKDGSRLVAQRIEQEPSLDAIYVLLSSGSVFLVTSSNRTHPSNALTVAPILDHEYPIVTGRIYAFDRATGESIWPCPAEVRQQGLVLWQPRELPVLPFIRTIPGRNRNSKPFTSVLCLDKSSGRSIFRRDDLNQTTNHFAIFAKEEDPSEVTMTLLTQRVELIWTNEPRPPEPPFMEDVQAGRPRSGSRGLLRMILGNPN
ncbi:MAG: PQQ-binding-like beta-propeller repeat protein [Pirellulales bacterium]|nr:PQQ-binding-like beta-propeller repeat protein [Pirellulales bacterium]